jgi:two-component system cell cycle response regulator CtrA
LGVDDFIETNWGRGYMVIDHRQDAGSESGQAQSAMPEEPVRAIA